MMTDTPQPDWMPEQWRHFNHAGLEQSNLCVLSVGALSISFCTVCAEILIRHNNETEADTFALNKRTYVGFMRLLMPRMIMYRGAVLFAAARCAWGKKASKNDRPVESTPLLAATHHKLLVAIGTFTNRYRRYLAPKVGETE